MVLRVDLARWGQTPEDLRHLALSAPHARTRERALALFDITQGRCATRLAERTGRHPQTVMGWVHAYNAQAGQTHEGLRSYRWGPFGEGTGAKTLRNPAKGGVSEQIVDLS